MPFLKNLCTIALPWGKYEYQILPMGLCNSPDIFQEKMSLLFKGLEYISTYIDDIIIISNVSFEEKLDKLLSKLNQKRFKVIVEKSFFARNELEYLGLRQGIMPLPDKVAAIKNIAVPTTEKQLRSVIGFIKYY